MSDPAIRLCPLCGEEQVERLISSGGGIVFKGPGFYATDYRQALEGGGKSTAAKASGDASSGSPDGASSTSDGASSSSDGASSGSPEGGSDS